MEKITRINNQLGSVDIFQDLTKNFILARPHGVINPSLLKEDLNQAQQFAIRCKGPWTYITNTEDVKIVNPFNLMYLKDVKKIKNLKKIVVFAPNPLNVFLLRLVSFVVRRDLVITKKDEFNLFMHQL